MEARAKEIEARSDSSIKITTIPGHFATNHSHINYYVDLSGIKTQYKMAMKAAIQLASKYYGTSVDAIICLEGTEVIGAFLAEELSQNGLMTINNGNDICVITPELNSNNQMLFRDNIQKMVWGKNVLLLISSASTGKTVNRALDCLNYYSGKLAGIGAIFSAIRSINGVEVHSVFTEEDLPAYDTFPPGACKMCEQKQKLDAIVNSFGYSKL
jgi:orotate phosphoribosyltransferase